jgi:transcriptional regulator with XRE-family HTH domain
MKTPRESAPTELGSKVRAIRKECGLSLEQLSAKSGVALATLSRMENGKGSGTFRTHQKVAEALGLPLPDLYRGLDNNHEETVPIHSQSGEAEIFRYDEKASAVFLAKQIAGKQMLPQMILISEQGATSMEQYPLGTERWLFCLEGTVQVQVGEQSVTLPTGGTLYFKASLPHQMKNTGTAAAKVISVTSPSVL